MLRLSRQNFLNRYLPMFLSAVLVLAGIFVYITLSHPQASQTNSEVLGENTGASLSGAPSSPVSTAQLSKYPINSPSEQSQQDGLHAVPLTGSTPPQSHPGDPLVRGGFKVLGGVRIGTGTPIIQTCTGGNYGNGSTATCTLPIQLSSGTTLVAVGYSGVSGTTLSLSGCGLTWTNIFSDTSSPNFTWDIWTATPTAGSSCTASQTTNASNWNFLHLMEISGIGVLDVAPLDNRSAYCSTGCTSGSLNTATNGDLVLFTGFDIGGSLITYTNFTNGFVIYQQNNFNNVNGGGISFNVDADLVQATAATISTTFTASDPSPFHDNILMAFKRIH